MAEISVGAAVGAGFDLIARKPLAVLSWGLLRFAVVAATAAVFAPLFIDIFTQASQAAQGGAPPNPATLMPRMLMVQGFSYLVNIVQLLVSAVVLCAAYRAVLHPDQGRFGYLRVGAPEFFLAVIFFAAGIALLFAMLILMIPMFIIIGILVAVHLGPVAAVVGVVGFIALVVGLIYVAVRFSFVGPMLVEDGKFHLFESWTMTKGRAGSLFLIGLSLVGLILLAELVIGVIAIAVGAAGLGWAAGGFANLQGFFHQPPGVILAKLAPILAVYALASIPIEGCLVAIISAPWAHAYRDVRPDAADAFA